MGPITQKFLDRWSQMLVSISKLRQIRTMQGKSKIGNSRMPHSLPVSQEINEMQLDHRKFLVKGASKELDLQLPAC